MKFLLRDEARATERRTPVTPKHASELIQGGVQLDVECSQKRIFSDADYEKAGCRLATGGSWQDADSQTVIVGLKELPELPEDLPNRMIHFAHAYKQQSGWRNELMRFSRGGGRLYDIEYLTGANGRRVAAFGYWAGWMGAALAIWRYLAKGAGKTDAAENLTSFDGRDPIIRQIVSLTKQAKTRPTAIVIGAKGRSGRGAVAALGIAGAKVTEWDVEETANMDRDKLLSHDILVNCVLVTRPGLLLATADDLSSSKCNLQVISDVACDPFSSFNPLPVYDTPTSWEKPFLDLGANGTGGKIELTAIDNLPSLIPREASEDFSSQFSPCLKRFDTGVEWQAARAVFEDKLAQAQA